MRRFYDIPFKDKPSINGMLVGTLLILTVAITIWAHC